MPSAKFNEVYGKTREIKSGPSNDDLLNVRGRPLSFREIMLMVGDQLYAYAKVAQGEDIEKAAKPGMMDFTVRYAAHAVP
jgi:diazepam-binding inhibitor (GABA receptor modulating acyl-CoA-binding protein)